MFTETTDKNTSIDAWGPHLWHSIHLIALNAPDKLSTSDKLNYKMFFESLKDVIPCLTCADSYAEHLQSLSIDQYLDSAANLFAWTVHIHNMVNETYGKKRWSVEEAKVFYVQYKGPRHETELAALKLCGKDGQAMPRDDASTLNTSYTYYRSYMVNLLILLACTVLIVIILWLLVKTRTMILRGTKITR
jgi:hypothetical protein